MANLHVGLIQMNAGNVMDPNLAFIEEMARLASIPVINALTNYEHPCQILADLQTIQEHKGRLAGLRLAYFGDGNNNVTHSLLFGCAKMGMHIAVASPKGLVTPVVRQADRMRIAQIAAETRRPIDKAMAGRLSMEDMDGGTFSVSNLGMMGVEQFDAIINPPQGAILAVGAAMRQPVETVDGDIAFESRIALTLSVDHRAIDGAAGARFLQTLKGLIEAPEGLFA